MLVLQLAGGRISISLDRAALRKTSRASFAMQPTRLRITNGCRRATMWLESWRNTSEDDARRPLKVQPLESIDINITHVDQGLASYWPASRCWGLRDSCSRGSQHARSPREEDFSSRFQ